MPLAECSASNPLAARGTVVRIGSGRTDVPDRSFVHDGARHRTATQFAAMRAIGGARRRWVMSHTTLSLAVSNGTRPRRVGHWCRALCRDRLAGLR